MRDKAMETEMEMEEMIGMVRRKVCKAIELVAVMVMVMVDGDGDGNWRAIETIDRVVY